jgi:hypothetical protein
MIYALSEQAKNMIVADGVMNLSGKTKEAAAFIEKVVGENAHVLIVLAEPVADVIRSTANLEGVLVTQASRMNVYETLLAGKIIITESAVRALETRLIKVEKGEKSEPTSQKAPKIEKAAVVKGNTSKHTELKMKLKTKVVPKAIEKKLKVCELKQSYQKEAKTVKAKPAAKKTVTKKVNNNERIFISKTSLYREVDARCTSSSHLQSRFLQQLQKAN